MYTTGLVVKHFSEVFVPKLLNIYHRVTIKGKNKKISLSMYTQ